MDDKKEKEQQFTCPQCKFVTKNSRSMQKHQWTWHPSNNIERAVNLIKKSYLATGEQDSIDKYIDLFSKKYPQLNFNNFDYYSSIILQEEKPITEEVLKDTIELEKSIYDIVDFFEKDI